MCARNVLVLSATASAINVIKSLQNEGDLKLFVSDVSRYASGLYQAGVTPLIVPPARALDEYCAALDRIIAEYKIDIIIPTSDRDVEGVVTLIDRGWNPPVAMFRPKLKVQQLLSNKLALATYLRACGLPAPASWRSLEEATFPLVVKLVREGGGRGVFVASDRNGAAEAIRRCREGFNSECMIQEYLPGGIGSTYISLMLFDHDGALVANDVMLSSLTYFTWGGGGNAGYASQDEDIKRTSKLIIEAVGGWKGPLNLEFRRHAVTGLAYVIEANCRLNGYSYLTTMNGSNYPRAIVDLLSERTACLPFNVKVPGKNFVLGFREMLLDSWVG
jgi:carbamoylphosphate synthase large subunit